MASSQLTLASDDFVGWIEMIQDRASPLSQEAFAATI